MSITTMQNNRASITPFQRSGERRLIPLAATLVIAGALTLARPASAATYTFQLATQTGGVYDWSVGGNWGGTAPASSQDNALIFPSNATAYTAYNDIANDFAVNSLTFSNTSSTGAITLSGDSIELVANSTGVEPVITNGTGTTTINSLLDLGDSGSGTVTINNGGGTLNLTGGTNFANYALNINGTGTTNFIDTTGAALAIEPDTLAIGTTAGSNETVNVTNTTGPELDFEPARTIIGGSNSGGAGAGGTATLALNNNVFMSGGGGIYLYGGGTFKVLSGAIVNMSALSDGGGVTNSLFPTGSNGTGTSTVDIDGSSVLQVSFATTSGLAFTYSGNVIGSTGLLKVGDDTSNPNTNPSNQVQIFAGTGNTFSGTVGIYSNATLRAGGNNTLFPSADVYIPDTTATLDLANHSAAVGSLAGAGSVTLGTGTLAINGLRLPQTFSGTITGTGTGAAITKTGTQTETFSGTNTYTGTTVISGGALSVTGTTSSGTITAASGGTLEGTGHVGAVTVATGGTIAPGHVTVGTYGTLNATSVVLNSNSTLAYNINLANTQSDLLNATSLSKASSSSVFTFAFSVSNTFTTNETYTLATDTGSNISTDPTTGIKVSDLRYTFTPGQTGLGGMFGTDVNGYWTGTFTTMATPEPSAFALFALGLAPLGVALRNRRKRLG